MVVEDLGVEGLQCYPALRVVGHHAHELARGERGDGGGRDGGVELGGAAHGGVAAVNRHALPPLQDLAEALGELFGRLPGHLPADDVAHDVHHHLGLLPAIVLPELAVVLHPKGGGYFVGAGRGDEAVDAVEVDGGELVEDQAALEPVLLVDQLDSPGNVEGEHRPVHLLLERVVAQADELGGLRVVEVQREVVAREHVVELRGDEPGHADLGAGDLPLELVHGLLLEGGDEGVDEHLDLGLRL